MNSRADVQTFARRSSHPRSPRFSPRPHRPRRDLRPIHGNSRRHVHVLTAGALLLLLHGARRGGRTLTPLRELDFESSASANSAIRAKPRLRHAQNESLGKPTTLRIQGVRVKSVGLQLCSTKHFSRREKVVGRDSSDPKTSPCRSRGSFVSRISSRTRSRDWRCRTRRA